MSPGFSDLYRQFEDRFRGSADTIAARLAQYGPLLDELPPEARAAARAIDLGCGRGEWLRILAEAGFEAVGVDTDEGMLEVARKGGAQVFLRDAVEFLREEPDASAAIVSAFHVVEHVPIDYVLDLLREAYRVLADGGLLILETPNPENLSVGAHTFHFDPTHRRPLPPPLLAFLAEQSGFADHAILRINGTMPDVEAGPIERAMGVVWEASRDYACLGQKREGASAEAPSVLAAFAEAHSQPNPANLVAVLDQLRSADRQIAALSDSVDALPRLSERIEGIAADTSTRHAGIAAAHEHLLAQFTLSAKQASAERRAVETSLETLEVRFAADFDRLARSLDAAVAALATNDVAGGARLSERLEGIIAETATAHAGLAAANEHVLAQMAAATRQASAERQAVEMSLETLELRFSADFDRLARTFEASIGELGAGRAALADEVQRTKHETESVRQRMSAVEAELRQQHTNLLAAVAGAASAGTTHQMMDALASIQKELAERRTVEASILLAQQTAAVQQARAGEMVARLEGESARVAMLEADVAALRRSTSWRMTAPMRFAIRAMRFVLSSPGRAARRGVRYAVDLAKRSPRARAAALFVLRIFPPLDRRVRALAGLDGTSRGLQPGWSSRWNVEPDQKAVGEWSRALRSASKRADA
ncbi:methyltransferase domain-containing protein [Aureimonas mangrovi]|uniref:methyltransferase domain-containing protein n=1 Tax=Aureimonas mangrovi TaxID=2758041 RepID=UPI00163D6FC4|nr:methyltransferase domain-containing protein [Aureimonas mangrovi]